jgi:hypothetical protein
MKMGWIDSYFDAGKHVFSSIGSGFLKCISCWHEIVLLLQIEPMPRRFKKVRSWTEAFVRFVQKLPSKQLSQFAIDSGDMHDITLDACTVAFSPRAETSFLELPRWDYQSPSP